MRYLALLLLLSACTSKPYPPEAPPLLGYFNPTEPADTLYADYELEFSIPDTIPQADVRASLPDSMRQELEDWEFGLFTPGWRLPQGEQYELCLLNEKADWVHFRYLLVYDRSQGKFVEMHPFAYLYGGDGGQAMAAGWLFDYDGDGDRDVLTHFVERVVRPDPEVGALEEKYHDVGVLLWEDGGFEIAEKIDSVALKEQFWFEGF